MVYTFRRDLDYFEIGAFILDCWILQEPSGAGGVSWATCTRTVREFMYNIEWGHHQSCAVISWTLCRATVLFIHRLYVFPARACLWCSHLGTLQPVNFDYSRENNSIDALRTQNVFPLLAAWFIYPFRHYFASFETGTSILEYGILQDATLAGGVSWATCTLCPCFA